jgi:serine/threonine protein kinase
LIRNVNWSAPEILSDNGHRVCELSDVWSLALVAAEILTGEVPFDSDQYRLVGMMAFVEMLKNGSRPILPANMENCIKEAVRSVLCLSSFFLIFVGTLSLPSLSRSRKLGVIRWMNGVLHNN